MLKAINAHRIFFLSKSEEIYQSRKTDELSAIADLKIKQIINWCEV